MKEHSSIKNSSKQSKGLYAIHTSTIQSSKALYKFRKTEIFMSRVIMFLNRRVEGLSTSKPWHSHQWKYNSKAYIKAIIQTKCFPFQNLWCLGGNHYDGSEKCHLCPVD